METMTVINPTQTQQLNSDAHTVTTHAPKPIYQESIQKNTKPTDMLSQEQQQEQLKKTTHEFNEMSDSLNLDIKFAYNDKIDQLYLNVIDKETGRIIRKLPSEEAMKIRESMKDLVGTLYDKKG